MNEIVIILALVVLNGFFAMAELAVVSARLPRLKRLSQQRVFGAHAAVTLASDPGKFLSTVQIGITLIGLLAGAYSGARLSDQAKLYLDQFPALAGYTEGLSLALVVLPITYLSLVIGELVPKQIALKNAERIACFVALPMHYLSRLTVPIVALLDISNRIVLRLMGIRPESNATVTEEEVKALIAEGAQMGIFEHKERQMIEGIMRLPDMPVRAIITPRQNIAMIEVNEPVSAVIEKIRRFRHSRYILYRGSVDQVLGVLSVKDMLVQLGEKGTINLPECCQEVMVIPESTSVLNTLEIFRKSPINLVLVVDEYGSIEGVATLKNVLQAIVGTLPEHSSRKQAGAVAREGGGFLLDGMLAIHEAEETLGVTGMADEDDEYHTLAGFILAQLGRMPREGDRITWNGWTLEIVDMDERRIDKIMATSATPPADLESSGSDT